MARVLAGSEEDLRWRTMSPDKPQTEAPPKKKKKSDIIKELIDKNTVLSRKLNDVIYENIALRKALEGKGKTVPKAEAPTPAPKGVPKAELKPEPKIEPKPVKKVIKKVAKKVIKKAASARRR